ncbi:MAG: hypothetical protein LJE67_00145 [Salaquimonas sp.]|nr:hypothetical protein [Salaquimonas sp.]
MDDKIEFLNIVCFKWGDPYPSEEVNIMQAMVDRNLSVPHAFHCVTDNPEGLDESIIAHPLPKTGARGLHQKLLAFSDDFLGLNGQFAVFLDIDMVIVGSLDFLADDPQKDLIITRNWAGANRTEKFFRGNSTFYRLKIGSHTEVWEKLLTDSDDFMWGDQEWISEVIDDLDYFPNEKVVSYKYHCGARSFKMFGSWGTRLGLTTASFIRAHAPRGASVVSFHGHPLPREVRDGRYRHWKQAQFVLDHWHR